MGATNCPETPRQKMITLMYLVYTAMLALNVSAEVVQGFKSIGNAMTESNINTRAKLEDTYANFEVALKNSPDKVRDKYDKAQQVKALSMQLEEYIDSLSYLFIGELEKQAKVKVDPNDPTSPTRIIPLREEDGKTPILDSIREAMRLGGYQWIDKLDNTHQGARTFLLREDGKPDDREYPEEGRAVELRKRVHEYKENVKKILGEDSNNVKLAMAVDRTYTNKEGKEVSWEHLNFHETVAGSILVTLVQLKAETMNAEFDVVNTLYKQVSKGDYSFDQVAIISRPKSTYILQGGQFETKFNVAAYDSRQGFRANIGGTTYTSADSGAVVYRTICNNVGPQTVRGTAYVANPEGGVKEYPFEEHYFVARPVGVLMLHKMQVAYIGVDNPLSVSVPGVDGRNVTASIDGGGTLTKVEGDGEYILRPDGSKKEIMINIFAKVDNKVQQMGSRKIRAKDIPTPLIEVAGYLTGSPVTRKSIQEGAPIQAKRPQGFDFELAKGSMKVTSVEVYIANKAYQGSNKITPEMVQAIKKTVKGDQINVDATVQMPSGKQIHAYCSLKIKQ